jgi:hypothetical protein
MLYRYALLACFFAGRLDAYTLPPAFLVQFMAQKYSSEKAVKHSWPAMVSQTGKNHNAVPAIMNLDQKGLSQTLAENKPEKLELFFLDAAWACRDQGVTQCEQILVAYFKKAGINHNVVSLGIYDNEPVYIMGALAGDLKKTPQLWFFKESYLPVHEKNSRGEITWNKWMRNAKNGVNYPRLMDFKIGSSITSIANS